MTEWDEKEFGEAKKEARQRSAQYVLNRNDLMLDLKNHLPVLQKIVMEGIEGETEARIARAACSIVVSEILFESAKIQDAIGLMEDEGPIDQALRDMVSDNPDIEQKDT